MNKLPAFLLYATDFIVGTAEMGLAETGVYIKLLCHQWDKGHLPAETQKLHRLVGATTTDEQTAVNNVLSKFETRGKTLVNRRLEAVRNTQQQYRNKRTQSARKAAQARWGRGEDTAKTQLELVAQVPQHLQHLQSQITTFFGVNTAAHVDKQQEVARFLISIEKQQLLPHFTGQWLAYTKYKQGNGGPVHGFARYIGQYAYNYQNGAWNAENWQAKLEKQHGNAKSIAKTEVKNATTTSGKRKQYTQSSSPIIHTS